MDVSDREQVLEDALQSDVFTLLLGCIQLEQRLESARLDVEEMGHIHARLELRKRDLVHHVLLPRAGCANTESSVGAKRFVPDEADRFENGRRPRGEAINDETAIIRRTAVCLTSLRRQRLRLRASP